MFDRYSFNRRQFLSASLAVVGGGLATNSMFAADSDLPWIDAHSHIWPPETDKFPLVAGQTKKDLNPPQFHRR